MEIQGMKKLIVPIEMNNRRFRYWSSYELAFSWFSSINFLHGKSME